MSGHPGALDVLAAAARRQLAECWAQRGAGAVDPTDQANYLARARRHDRRAPTLLARSGPAGRALYAAGNSARQREDWETAYRLYAAALRADPTLAFARRRAEAARSRRLASAAR